MIAVRNGRVEDGAAAMEVVRRSIAELCGADHNFDAQDIADWIVNKTDATWLAWRAREDAVVLVAQRADTIIGVGMIDDQGRILLNYVSPDARFSGVSKTIVDALEQIARKNGNAECRLESTRTAKAFYENCGYTAVGNAELELGKRL